jgi:EmrB/QacA subfamily drug resistance transporter
MSFFSKFATDRFRWVALVFLSVGLAIVIIDNTVLNVAIPYILRDLNASLDGIQWVVSGYALIIATLLILMGRLGDILGRKKIFQAGIVLFAIGSFTASVSHSITTLFIGEALIEAIGAAAMLTSTLSLLASEFHGKERAIAFGVWGSVAGASATIGPLLGGYFTTYHSWRWSLRINVVVAIIAILGTIFIKESKGENGKGRFDYLGTVLSGLGLFSLVFGFIEAQKYGWWSMKEIFKIGSTQISFGNLSIVPVAFLLAVLLLLWFVIYEIKVERQRKFSPILRMSMFSHGAFSLSIVTLLIISMGQFGIFFILPIFLQNVIGLTALKTGIAFLAASITLMIVGPVSGFIASKVGPKAVIVVGMIFSVIGIFWISGSLDLHSSILSLIPSMICFGIGAGATSAQLTNLILSAVPIELAGEASSVNAATRQVGTSIGIAILGTVLASTIATNIATNVNTDRFVPDHVKNQIVMNIDSSSVESGTVRPPNFGNNLLISLTVTTDIKNSLTKSVKTSTDAAAAFVLLGAVVSFFIPKATAKN